MDEQYKQQQAIPSAAPSPVATPAPVSVQQQKYEGLAASPAGQAAAPQQAAVPSAASVPSAATPAQVPAPAGVPDYSTEIGAMYDLQRESQLRALEEAYNRNRSTLQGSYDELSRIYGGKTADLAAQYERNRMSTNEALAASGLNVGAGSQANLAQQANYLKAYGQIGAEQSRAERDLSRQIADLEMNYKSAVSQAIADNDYQKAAALLDEYKRRDEAAKEEQRYQDKLGLDQQRYDDAQALQKAQILAQYGDFSGYAEIYGDEIAAAMKAYFDQQSGGGYGYGGGSSSGSNGDASSFSSQRYQDVLSRMRGANTMSEVSGALKSLTIDDLTQMSDSQRVQLAAMYDRLYQKREGAWHQSRLESHRSADGAKGGSGTFDTAQ